jgi:choline transport protein
MSAILGNICVALWSLQHENYVFQRWHVFIAYLIMTWMACSTVLFANRALPAVNNIGLIAVVGGLIISVLVCSIMPSTNGSGHAQSSFVWSEWLNNTGWKSGGFVFIAGMLNGAYAVGTVDAPSHLAEEIPNPSRNVPMAIGAQMVIGFLTAFLYLIALFYGINDLDSIFETSANLPLAAIYYQATNSRSAATGLLVIFIILIFSACIACYITVGRTLWTLARDGATPFSGFLGTLHPAYHNQFNATLVAGIFTTCLGCIYIGSLTAFNAFVGSYVVLSTSSYLAAVLPFMLTGRFNRRTEDEKDRIEPGSFKMNNTVGYAVNLVTCLYIMVTVVVYCFPYSQPFTAQTMNYSRAITGGLTVLVTIWWIHKRKEYVRPTVVVTDGLRAVAEPAPTSTIGVSPKHLEA